MSLFPFLSPLHEMRIMHGMGLTGEASFVLCLHLRTFGWFGKYHVLRATVSKMDCKRGQIVFSGEFIHGYALRLPCRTCGDCSYIFDAIDWHTVNCCKLYWRVVIHWGIENQEKIIFDFFCSDPRAYNGSKLEMNWLSFTLEAPKRTITLKGSVTILLLCLTNPMSA